MTRVHINKQFPAEEYRKPLLVAHARTLTNSRYYVCPRCGITLDREFISFCDRCGQHLDWKHYRTATVLE